MYSENTGSLVFLHRLKSESNSSILRHVRCKGRSSICTPQSGVNHQEVLSKFVCCNPPCLLSNLKNKHVILMNFSSSCRRLRAVLKRAEVPFRLLTILNQFQTYFSSCMPMLFRIIIRISDNYPDNYPSPEEISSG